MLAAGLVFAEPAKAQSESAPEQIMWTADSWTRTGDTYTIRGLTIEGGELLVEADRAVTTSLEFSGTWELEGSIRMSVGTSRLLASAAHFEFEAGELVAGELEGDPATFEQTAPEGEGPVRGEASRIVYDSVAGTVQMQGSARFTRAQNSMSGCDFLYELDGGLVSASSECGVPLSIIYVPTSGDGAPGSDGDAAPETETETGTATETESEAETGTETGTGTETESEAETGTETGTGTGTETDADAVAAPNETPPEP